MTQIATKSPPPAESPASPAPQPQVATAPREKPRIKWYRCPVPREQLSQLNKRSDFQGFLQAGGYLALIIATAVGAIYSFIHWPWYVTVMIAYVHCMFCAFTINGVHELVHNSVFKTKWLNAFFLRIFGFIGWHNFHHFWASHTEHHKYTLHPPDDLEVVLPYEPKLVKNILKWGIINLMWPVGILRYHLPYALWRLPESNVWTRALYPDSEPERRWKMRRWVWIMLVGHGVIITVSLIMGWWMVPIVVSLTPMCGSWFQFVCNSTQHIGLRDNVPDYRLCCRTITVNPFFQFLYWHMNFHTEHHMYAAVPCYNLGKLHKLIKADMPTCTHGLIATWREIIMITKRQKIDPSYQYEPELPSPSPAKPIANVSVMAEDVDAAVGSPASV